MDVKLVLLDLDGTLLDGDSKVPQDFFSLVPKLKEKGVNIGIASGRNKNALEQAFGSLFNEMTCVTSNGCANYIDGKGVSFTYLDKDVLEKLLNVADHLSGCSFQVFFPDYILLKTGNPLIEGLNKIGFHALPCDHLNEHLDGVVLVSSIALDGSDFYDDFNQVQGNFQMVRSSVGVLDFTPQGVSKAYGASKLAEALNISMDEIMAVGDAENDLELLKAVGHPVAMKNAMDIVKENCKYITKESYKENGCIHFLEEFFHVN